MNFLGYLILIPLALLYWIVVKVIDYSIQGGKRRLVGILACPVLGGLCIFLGWWMVFIGYLDYRPDGAYQVTWPIPGWTGMVGGAVFILFGTLRCAFGHEK
jgi:UDP-N-acetylmuramyl pentapeptide phosphotransferase/UDP-N-acetylglucosamine-1-phosphate transferase